MHSVLFILLIAIYRTGTFWVYNAFQFIAFKAAAALQHTTPQRALAGMLAKHIVSLYDMCFAEETVYPMDTWDEKITDSLNYLFLLKAIVKEGHTN